MGLLKGSEDRGSVRLHPPWEEKEREREREGGKDGIYRYLNICSIATKLRGGSKARGPIWQVSYCLLGQGALDDIRVIAIVLQAGGIHTNS